VKDLNLAIIDLAAYDSYAFALSARSIAETPQKFRAFRRHSERDGYSCHVEQERNISDFWHPEYEEADNLRFFASLRMTRWRATSSIRFR
jgi:hypothetical protein